MGFFDFFKDAGKRLGFGDDEEANAEELKKELDSHNLGTEAVKIEKKGDTVVLKGAVKDQSIFEKAIVAMGNTLGISKVEASELKIGLPENKMALDGSNINDII
ncbi:MAG: BON domain-containing protein, partial [Pseudomonadota bacterium]